VYASAGVRETQKVEGFRLPFPIPLSIFDGKSPELNQARLFRMQFQPELSQPSPQLLQESLRYFPVLEPDDEVSRPRGVSPRASLRTVLEPLCSYGSRHGTTPHPHLPVRPQLRIASRDPRDPMRRPAQMSAQLLVFPIGPSGQ
jgi:hypothetical protein